MTIFDSASLTRKITVMLHEANIPKDHTIAVFGAVDLDGARGAIVAQRKGKGWTIEVAGELAHEWHGDTIASIGFKTSF